MIQMMRRHRKALQIGLLLVIVAFVASLFVFGATGSRDGDLRDNVATVNGEAIPIERYHRRYQSYLQAYQQIYRDRFSTEMAERLGLPQQVVGDLVQEALIVQRAGAEGLMITDEELNARIHAMPAFQENGRFALKRYQEILKRNGLTAAGFETEMRRDLTRSKVEAAVRSGVKVSDTELEQAFRLKREEVRVIWALVELAPIVAATDASDEEITAYLAKHPDEFRQPDRRKVQYVTVSARDFVTPVSDAEVEKYYTEHVAEFESPRQARVSHILARVGETGGSEAEDKARAKITEAIRRAKAGEDFAKLAKELSDDPGSASRGGDLGLVGKGEMVPQFEQALFALKQGEVTPEPVRTPFGFHAIKVFEVKEGGRKPLKEVAAAIKSKLSAEAAERAAKAKAEQIRPPLQAAKDFMAEAKKLGLHPIETTMSRVERVAGIAAPDPLEETAFALSIGGTSAPVTTPVGLVVLKSVEAIPAGVPPLAEIKDKVAASVKRQRAETTVMERAKQLGADGKSGDFGAAAKKVGATTGETPRFSRSKPAERLPGDVMLAALQTPAGQLSEPVKAQQGYYVLKVLERVPPDMGGLQAERDKIQKEVLAQKQSLAWESWLTGARANAKIETHLPVSRRS